MIPLAKRVLIVEDGKRPRELLTQNFSRRGFEVKTAGSLREAKQQALAAEKTGEFFDLIVADVDLGDKWYLKHRALDGYLFCRWYQKKYGRTVPTKITLHSKGFDNHRPVNRFLTAPLVALARKQGMRVQGKSVLAGRRLKVLKK